MVTEISAHLLPRLVHPDEFRDCRAIVIDVLRATTTCVQALGSGASCVWPCLTVDDARALAGTLAKTVGQPLLAGERDCLRVDGFDLGNSPTEYSSEVVANREIVFTTTNGTAAMLHCGRASRVFLSAFTNLAAAVRLIQADSDDSPVRILCSGTNGEITREDVLLAGALVQGLLDAAGPSGITLNDESRLAAAAWSEIVGQGRSGEAIKSLETAALADAFSRCLGGRNLIGVGNGGDLLEAAQVDRWDVVPEFLPGESRIVLAEPAS